MSEEQDTQGRLKRAFKEDIARFFEDPTRDGLREILRHNLGELNEFEFQREWPRSLSAVAKSALAIGNTGGGAVVAGVAQAEDGSLTPCGVPNLTDKTKIFPGSRTLRT